MRKISRVVSKGLKQSWSRQLGTANAVTVTYQNHPVAVLIHTFIDKKDEEKSKDSYLQYRDRSLSDLAKQIPEEMRDKRILIVKVNQTALDPLKFEQGNLEDPPYHGHVTSILGKCASDGVLSFEKNSLISKTDEQEDRFFEDQDEYLMKKFIRGEIHSEPAAADYPVKEFIVLIDPERVGLNLEGYLSRVKKLIEENAPWDAIKDSCGHAVFRGITGEDLPPKTSAQRAFLFSIMRLVKGNEALTDKLREGIMMLDISKPANEVGKDLAEYDKKMAEKTSSSSGQQFFK